MTFDERVNTMTFMLYNTGKDGFTVVVKSGIGIQACKTSTVCSRLYPSLIAALKEEQREYGVTNWNWLPTYMTQAEYGTLLAAAEV
jgi:hypothetical protein